MKNVSIAKPNADIKVVRTLDDKNLTQSYHSQVYDNFLAHWKYIKREKKNGKWVYTYENSKGGSTTKKKSAVDKINDLPGADKLNRAFKPLDEYIRLYQEVGDPKIKADGKIPDAVRKMVDKGKAWLDSTEQKSKKKKK